MIITNLLTNMVVLAVSGNCVPTNTPALQNYAFQVMFTNAQALGARWQLDKTLITSNNISNFSVKAAPKQIYANIQFGERYLFGTTKAGFLFFYDLAFREETTFPEWMTNGELADRYGGDLKRWLQATNVLTFQNAQLLAESAMLAYGVPTNQMGFLQPKIKEQLKLVDRPLPYYKFEWESDKGGCKVQVSGIISNIVRFEFEGPEQLRLKPPANYLESLGLSTNTVFVKPLSPGTFKLYEE